MTKMVDMKFCVKRSHYDGGDSVVGFYETESEATEHARSLNEQYQAGNYSVEPYDPEKLRSFSPR